MYTFRSPIRKQCCFSSKSPLPILHYNSLEKKLEPINEPQCRGIFNGFNVTVETYEDITALCTKGNFGATTLSRGYSSLKKRKKRKNSSSSPITYDERIQNKNVAPSTSKNLQETTSTLHLMLEEAFFLAFALKCLKVYRNNEILSTENMWNIFQNTLPNFVERYVSYHYFRAKGWVVKPGIKYGGDFLLYKEGLAFYHASFVVIIISNRNEEKNTRSFNSLLAVNRAVETVKKELLICRIFIPDNFDNENINHLSLCKVSEFIFKRWIASGNREMK